MNRFFVRAVGAALASAVLFTCGACRKKQEDPTAMPYVYQPRESQTAEGETAAAVPFTVNKNWQQNFTLQYRYFDRSQGEETVHIRETRTEDAFAAEYTDEGDILYYKENGANIDYYLILKEGENVHSLIKRKKIGDLSSTFMKLSDVSAEMPLLSNVMYMYDEEIGGRTCKKYIQRAYESGKAKETVYVWVDSEYGFAAKCEGYDENGQLKISWEVTQFRTGGVTDADIRVNPSAYTFTEREGAETQ